MSEFEGAAAALPVDADRLGRLESRLAALEKRLAAYALATDAALRTLKRELGTVARSIVQRGNRE